METTIVTIIGIILTMCGYSNIINISEILPLTNITEISTDTSILETNYTQEVGKDNTIKALNDINLDYLFSLKSDHLTNNFDILLNESDTLIYPDKQFQEIYLQDYRCDFYFDASDNVVAINFFDPEKVLKTEKDIKSFDDIQNILGKNQVYSLKTKYRAYNGYVAALIYELDKYSYLFYTSNIDGAECNTLICKTEDKKLDEMSKIEREFRSDLPDIIISKKDEIFSSPENKVLKKDITDNYTIIGAAEGDLNNDGKNDFSVVAEQKNTRSLWGNGLRWIYVFEQTNEGNYKLTHVNKNLVLGAEYGGIQGDPFNGISINNGVLSIEDYTGGSWKSWNAYDFWYDNNELVLKKHTTSSSFNSSGEKYTYDFEKLTGTLSIFGKNVPTENGEKIIYQTIIKDEKFYFNSDNFNLNNILYTNFYLPSFNDYNFYPDYPVPNFFPQEALDIVKNLYYNDMEKVYIPLTEEEKKNYCEAIGYTVPDYYYKKDDYILVYFSFVQEEKLIHEIYYFNEKIADNSNKMYRVSDSSGKILD